MIILDTDHIVLLQSNSAGVASLVEKLLSVNNEIATTIISVEEEMRCWLSAIHRSRDVMTEISLYGKLQQLFFLGNESFIMG